MTKVMNGRSTRYWSTLYQQKTGLSLNPFLARTEVEKSAGGLGVNAVSLFTAWCQYSTVIPRAVGDIATESGEYE